MKADTGRCIFGRGVKWGNYIMFLCQESEALAPDYNNHHCRHNHHISPLRETQLDRERQSGAVDPNLYLRLDGAPLLL